MTPLMGFHLGKPILVMLLLAVCTGGAALLRSSPKRADVVLWCFAESHVKSYKGDGTGSGGETPVARFTRLNGKSVEVVHVITRAENIRLMALFNMDDPGELLPDLAEIEIGSVGQYFRPPVDHVGFLPLNDYLKKSGWYERIVKSRFLPWSKNGVIFGVPHDLHPTTITYRKDLFDEAGVDLGSAKTWPEFRDKAREFQRYWKERGNRRFAIGLPTTAGDQALVMCMQRHINLVDDYDRIFIADEKVVDTLAFYIDLIAGPEPIATDFNPAAGQNYKDMERGDICAMITADWSIGYMKTYAANMKGKVAMMPLPRFDPDDAPTVSWGGTMMGIPRKCKNPDLAWKLLQALYLEHEAIMYRRQQTSILPPVREYWNDEVYSQPDPYFMDGVSDQLFIALADQIPPRYATPFTTTATGLLSDVVNSGAAHVRSGAPGDLKAKLRVWLEEARLDLAKRIEFGKFRQ